MSTQRSDLPAVQATAPAPTSPISVDGSLGSGRIQSVERAARILLAFATPEQQVTVADLARMLEVHKSTASRLVSTLMAHGLLARGEADDQLRLGPELARLGRLAGGTPDIAELAQPAMHDLTAVTGEATTLSVGEGTEAVTLAQSDGTFVVGTSSWVGHRAPLHATSDGKALLAYGAASLSGQALPACTADTIVDASDLLDELAAIRERGWAESRGEFELGLNGVAAPVLDPTGRCVAALCLSGPSYRFTDERLPELGALARRAADRVSAALAVRAGSAA